MSTSTITTISHVIVLAIIGGIGSLFAFAAACLTYRNLRRYFKWHMATGTVYSIKEEAYERKQCAFRPGVRFMTSDGHEVIFESSVATSHRGYRVGDSVDIQYDPQAPDQAEIVSFLRLWFPVVILLVFASVFFFIALTALKLPSEPRLTLTPLSPLAQNRGLPPVDLTAELD